MLLLLFLINFANAGSIKISDLPLGTAATTSANDSFPFVDSVAVSTKRLKLPDLVNLPGFISTYAPIASPTFTGVVTSPSFVGPLTGNASTATALFADPTDCGANTYATTIAANGNLTCSTVSDTGLAVSYLKADGSRALTGAWNAGQNITATAFIGNASTATALAANPTDCAAGTYATAIDASGNLTCAVVAGSTSVAITDGGNAPYTVLTTDQYVRTSTTLTAQRVYTLDTCTTLKLGERHTFKNKVGQTFNIVLTAAGSDLIEGVTTYTIYPGDSITTTCAAFASFGNWDLN